MFQKILLMIPLFCIFVNSSPLISQEKSVDLPSPTIDQILLKKAKLDNFKPISDEVFLRRTYLSIGNRIPTFDEIKAYASDTSASKRKNLIDKLINSLDYNEAMYPFWADMLRLESDIKGVYGKKYEEWVKKSIADNKPYDQIVYELITASGKLYQNGAIGYYLRDEGNILETASTTSQIFLGTQIGCAQCHDHAFEDWTQKQFYEFASYLGKVTIKDDEKRKEIRKEFRKEEDLTPQERNLLRKVIEATTYEILDRDKKELKYPADYKYKNAKPNETVKPHVFFGDQPILQNESQRRESFAKWVTSKENLYFTKIISNRLWKRVMGQALFEPIDDYNSNTKVSHPEILELLEKIMKDLNYDMRKFQSILYNTQYYQTPSTIADSTSDAIVAERPLQRMKAEQVWNSLLTLTRKDINEYYAANGPSEMEDLIVALQKDGLTEENKSKLLAKLNDVGNKRKTQNSKNEDMMNESLKMNKMEDNVAKENAKEPAKDKDLGLKSKKRLNENLEGRASNITSPAPDQHFLNFFGQSDRQIIEEGNQDPNLPQVLALLNSQLTTNFILKNSYIKRQVNMKKENIEKVNYLYQVILTRYPTEKESKASINYLLKNSKEGIEDIIWALVNSREFIFIQ
jgi:hypothetical protein